MSRELGYTSVVIGAAALAWGFLSAGFVAAAYGLLVFGLLWLVAQQRGWRWFAGLGLVSMTAAAAAGLWLGLGFGWMSVGCLGSLLAWDLTGFEHRLRAAASTDDVITLQRRHLAWLGVAATGGLLLSAAAGLVHVRLSFAWIFLLALAAIWGVAQVVAWLRR